MKKQQNQVTNLVILDFSDINENDFTFTGIDNIQLYYKKSYNYDSYNYIEKYFKNIVTFNEKEQFVHLNVVLQVLVMKKVMKIFN